MASPIPQVRLIQTGPMSPQMSPAIAQAQARAGQEIGEAVAGVGRLGMELGAKARRAKEAKTVSEFLLGLDEQASSFSNELLTQSDTSDWGTKWKEKVDSARAQFDELPLSEEAKDTLGLRFNGWASSTTIRLEGQIAMKNVTEAKAQIAQGVQYHIDRGEFDEAREQASLLSGVGVGKAEQDAVERQIQQRQTIYNTEEDIKLNPKGTKEALEDPKWIEHNPGATLDDKNRLIQKADREIEEKRGVAMDGLEAKYLNGTIQEKDITDAQAAGTITENDALKMTKTLRDGKPPTDESIMKAWGILNDLREMRDQPGVKPEAYILAHNNARTAVLSLVPPNYQGDLKMELNYLTPAGRSESGGPKDLTFRVEDKRAIGRSVIMGGLNAGDFGDVNDPGQKDIANTKALKLVARLNQWLETDEGKAADVDAVQLKAAEFALGQTSTTAGAKYSGDVPGGGLRFVPTPSNPVPPNIPGKRMGTNDLLPELEDRTND